MLSVAMSASPGFAVEPTDVAKQMAIRMADAVAKGDVDAIAALYAKDAVVMFPSGKTASGRDEIREANAANQKAGKNELKFGGGRALGDDRQVNVIWTWELTVTPDGKEPIVSKGRSLLYLQKVDNQWHIVFDMFQAVQIKG